MKMSTLKGTDEMDETETTFIDSIKQGDILFMEYRHLTAGNILGKLKVSRKTKMQIHLDGTARVFGRDGWEKTSDKWARRAQLLHIIPELEARYLRQCLLSAMRGIRFEDLSIETLLAMHKAYMAGKQICEHCHVRPVTDNETRAVLLAQDEQHPTMAERGMNVQHNEPMSQHELWRTLQTAATLTVGECTLRREQIEQVNYIIARGEETHVFPSIGDAAVALITMLGNVKEKTV
jgi:hypothetical protein